jgi:subtilase family serine protease
MKTQNSPIPVPGQMLVVRGCLAAAIIVSLLPVAAPVLAGERHILRTQVPETVTHLQLLRRLPATNRLRLAIGLPLRNQDTLTNLLQELYDPASPNFRRYLTPEQFAEQFGPTDQDYRSVINYAASNRLEIVGTYGNRAVLEVAGEVSDIERAFQVALGAYQHPTEGRQFFAPGVQPSVDAALPILYVSGLDNYFLPRSSAHRESPRSRGPKPRMYDGSGTNRWYLGYDFRHAYAPGVNLTGAGQVVGLAEFDGYTASDITKYAALAGITNVPVQDIYPDGSPLALGDNTDEVSLDIEMVIAMAPGLLKLLVVEGNNNTTVMNTLASPPKGVPLPNQISCSFFVLGDTNTYPALLEMAAQGQSFFQCSGDDGAPPGATNSYSASFDYVTWVGGTELSMNGVGASWQSEQVWDYQYILGASAGAVVPGLAIPYYQQGIDMSRNGGSTRFRSIPDVAMVADNIELVTTDKDKNGHYTLTGSVGLVGGTSAAAPLWAGFTALANEQATAQGRPPVGFINPALYAIAKGPQYTNCFHDITVGNNTNKNSPNLYFAAPGYDLCTGWGSPTGQNLIDALVGLSGPVFVNFNLPGGFFGDGSYFFPFSSLAAGNNAVSAGGTIFIETAGSSSETMTISKPMTITAIDGPATVGVGH